MVTTPTTQARTTVDMEKYVTQLESRVTEQAQLIVLLNEKLARYESAGKSQSSDLPAESSRGGGCSKPADSFLIIGSRKTDISSVPNVRYSQIFVTRIDPDTSAKKLGENLQSSIPQLSSVKCSRLKTKYESYASFHVIVPEAEKVLISTEDAWPEGALVRLFNGKLLQTHVVDCFDSGNPDGRPKPVPQGSERPTTRSKVALGKVKPAGSKVAAPGVAAGGKVTADKSKAGGSGVGGALPAASPKSVKSPTAFSPKNTRNKPLQKNP